MIANLLKRSLIIRNASTKVSKDRWDLCVGVLIERLPVVSKKFNELENEFMKTLTQIEFENSLKSDHEIRKEKDILHQAKIKRGEIEVDLETTDGRIPILTAQDFEDLNQDELSKFKLGPRETLDDKKNNLKSLDRKLDDTLMLMLEENLNNKKVMLLPQSKWQEGETLRQTAERIVHEKIGTDLKVHFYGNSPCGFYKYKYDPTHKNETIGAKVFFYRATYKSGEITNKKDNFEWVTEGEMKEKVRSSYYNSVSQLLVS